MAFHQPGRMDFMPFGRNSEDLVGMDHQGRTILYDFDSQAVGLMPTLHAAKGFPISVSVGGDSLYVMSRNPQPSEHCFESLIYGPLPTCHFGSSEWYWQSLSPPPYVYHPGYRFVDEAYCIGAYTVVGDKHIWVSTAGAGTYSFDTASGVWSKAGEWALPFSGCAEYVPEHGLWFGFSSEYSQFCVSDLTAVSALRPPVLENEWFDLVPPEEASYLVPLGSGKFCIATFFETGDEDSPGKGYRYEKIERFAVFTGVEVVSGTGLRMIKHKSIRYILGSKTVNGVL